LNSKLSTTKKGRKEASEGGRKKRKERKKERKNLKMKQGKVRVLSSHSTLFLWGEMFLRSYKKTSL
jgi:hypothetical protein